ncbi:hypothetical protein ACEXQD_06440 [Herbiconiux sp. P15]|uniref:hypothetical protein n=1 Tax=Herbiconiux liukaitaii TaxID=3342799 RepID=UPI0035BB9115
MSMLSGTWNLSLRTPIGTMHATMTFAETGGVWTGTADDGTGPGIPLRAITTETTADGEHVTWSQSITKPLRLNLDFDVVVAGDQMTGHSRAGKLPRTTVSGTRAPS